MASREHAATASMTCRCRVATATTLLLLLLKHPSHTHRPGLLVTSERRTGVSSCHTMTRRHAGELQITTHRQHTDTQTDRQRYSHAHNARSAARRVPLSAASFTVCPLPVSHSGLVVSASDCGVREPRFDSHPRTVVFIATAAAICSLGHGLHTSTAVPRSTQPCIPPGSLNRVPASAGVKAGMSPLPSGR